jgi:hypothetical protein
MKKIYCHDTVYGLRFSLMKPIYINTPIYSGPVLNLNLGAIKSPGQYNIILYPYLYSIIQGKGRSRDGQLY